MVRRRPVARSGEVVCDLQRTTLSFLLATLGVALSALLGVSRAAASTSAADPIPAVARASGPYSIAPDPAHPTAAGDPVAAVDSGHVREALQRLERLPEPLDDSTRSYGMAIANTEVGVTATAMSSPVTGVDREPSPVPTASTTSTTAPATSTTTNPATPSTATEPTPTTGARPRTRPTTTPTTAAPDDRMAIREWRTISSADFRRFVEARRFTTTEYLTPALVHGTIVEADQRINVVLVHRSATAPLRVSPGDNRRQVVGAWAQAVGATAGINANWYSPFDGPAVSGGQVYGGSDHGYTALFGFTSDGDLVADHHHKIHDRVDPRVVEAVSGHPTLIHRGTATTDFGGDPTFTRRDPRTAIGVSADVDVLILVTVDGRQADAIGMTGAETTRLLRRLGAHDAVMLDGGGSSAMWIAGRGIVNRQSDPGRTVGNQIAVFGR